MTEPNSAVETPNQRLSWADMAQEDDEFGEEEHENNDINNNNNNNNNVSSNGVSVIVGDDLNDSSDVAAKKTISTTTTTTTTLPREQREYIRFMNVRRKKDFICFERVNGKLVNIVEGLELHTGIFSAAEQKRIVNYVASLQEQGRKGELQGSTQSCHTLSLLQGLTQMEQCFLWPKLQKSEA